MEWGKEVGRRINKEKLRKLHKETLLCMRTYKIRKIQTNPHLKKSLEKLESVLRAGEAAQ